MVYITRARTLGNEIDKFSSREKAIEAIEQYEAEDKSNGIYEPDFYEVAEEEEGVEMEVTVKEIYTTDGAYICGMTAAETKLGTVILSKKFTIDCFADFPKVEEVTIWGYNSIENFIKDGRYNFSKIYDIADEKTRAKFYDDKAAELKKAKKDGNTKHYLCKADGNHYTLKRTGWELDNHRVDRSTDYLME